MPVSILGGDGEPEEGEDTGGPPGAPGDQGGPGGPEGGRESRGMGRRWSEVAHSSLVSISFNFCCKKIILFPAFQWIVS